MKSTILYRGINTEAANGGVLQINCSAPTRKLKLNNFAEHIKILPGSLRMRKGVQNF